MSYPISNRNKMSSVPNMEPSLLREATAPSLSTSPFMERIEQIARKFVASLNEAALKNFNGRLERGLDLAKQSAVTPRSDPIHLRLFQVRSLENTQVYEVDLVAKTCTCPDSQKGNTCKHRVAAYYFEQASKGKIQPIIPVVASILVPPPPQIDSKGAFQPKSATPPQSTTSMGGLSRTDQILAELGFAPKLPKPSMPEPLKPAAHLGSLYHRYLHGNDLAGGEFSVTIGDITREKVIPHPSQPAVEKWCLWVDSLPSSMGNGILFGTRGEEDLMAIFGRVDVSSLKGKQVVVYPKPMHVAGQPKVSIRFRGVK